MRDPHEGSHLNDTRGEPGDAASERACGRLAHDVVKVYLFLFLILGGGERRERGRRGRPDDDGARSMRADKDSIARRRARALASVDAKFDGHDWERCAEECVRACVCVRTSTDGRRAGGD